jgi:tetratricopeptide (TPR) repeat protein
MRAVFQIAIMVASLMATVSRVSLADPMAKIAKLGARQHYEKGNKLYKLGAFDEAIAEYKAGALIEPAPQFDYNLAQANRQAGHYREALWHYDRFLVTGQPTGELRDSVIIYMEQMRAQLESKGKATSPPEPTQSASGPPSRPVRHDEATHGHHDWLGLTVTAAGTIGLGTAGYLFLRASQLNDQVDRELVQQQRIQLRDSAHTRVVAGTITASVGAVAVIVGLVRLALHHDEPSSAAAWWITPTSDGMMVWSRF